MKRSFLILAAICGVWPFALSAADIATPAVTITSPDAIKVVNLEVGQPRLYDSKPLRVIEKVAENLKGWQFTAIPQRLVVSYSIRVNKDGMIYAFGGGSTKQPPTREQFLGDDAAHWTAESGAIAGTNIPMCFRRKVTAGETISLHSFELSLAAESIALADASSPPLAAASGLNATTAELVKTYSNSLVFVTGTNGSGSGFLAKDASGTFLFTNAHVAAGVKGAGFKTLQGDQVQAGAAAVAVGHDIVRMKSTADQPLEIMAGVDKNTAIGDEIVVLGNAEGAGVINTIMGRIVGVGPDLVEVDAPFKPGNSGSPIIHLKSGKVIGLATYLTIRKFDSATKQPVKDPIIRRFGYRIDSVKTWQTVQWPAFLAQAHQMEAIDGLTKDLVEFLNNLSKGKIVSENPKIKDRIDIWVTAKTRKLSPSDSQAAAENFISFLKVTCQADISAVQGQLTYDYFQRELAVQERSRKEMADIFAKILRNMQHVL